MRRYKKHYLQIRSDANLSEHYSLGADAGLPAGMTLTSFGVKAQLSPLASARLENCM